MMQHDVSQLMCDGKPLPLRRAAGIIIKYDFTQSKAIVFGRMLGQPVLPDQRICIVIADDCQPLGAAYRTDPDGQGSDIVL